MELLHLMLKRQSGPNDSKASDWLNHLIMTNEMAPFDLDLTECCSCNLGHIIRPELNILNLLRSVTLTYNIPNFLGTK